MKILIWCLSFFLMVLVQVIVKNMGIVLGGIPTVILYSATWLTASLLSKAWDKRKEQKAVDQYTEHFKSPADSEPTHIPEKEATYKIPFVIACIIIVFLLGILVGLHIPVQKNNDSQNQLVDVGNASPTQTSSESIASISNIDPINRPVNCKIFRYSVASSKPNAPLEITTPSGDTDYFFIVSHIYDENKNAIFYMYPDTTMEVNIAPGEYEIYYACGNEWYGTKYLFGDHTEYHKLSDTFTFTEGSGWSIEMTLMPNGNLDSEVIEAEYFPS